MGDKTNNIPSSFLGYKREVVDKLLREKDALLETQREDIKYLRKELSRFENHKKDKNQSQEPER